MSEGRLTPNPTMFEQDPNGGNGAAAVIAHVLASKQPQELSPDVPQIVVVPAGCAAYEPDLSAWRDRPVRKTGVYHPATVDALVAITNLHGEDNENTTVWVHPTSGRVVTVFDDNGREFSGYQQHRAVLQLQETPEWAFWTGQDGKMVGQEAFAEHIEAGLAEVEQPDAADLLEIAQSFHVKKDASFRSATRLSSGEIQFAYEETLAATAGRKGDLLVPTTFILLLAPFVGETERQVVAKLRYRLSQGVLTLGYKLERPDKVVRDALDAVAETLAAEFPRVFVGEPA